MINPDLPVVLFDLDSTIYDTRHRHHLTPFADPTKTWADYAGACLDDRPFPGLVTVACLLWARTEIHIISGRDGSAEAKTRYRLREDRFPYDVLRMRELDDDETSNVDLKVAYIRELRAQGRQVALAFDDWPETCKGIEAEGVPLICVGNSHVSEPDGLRHGLL